MSDKPPLYLDFADFALRMRKDDNFFTRILAQKFDVKIVDKPDLLIHSDAGQVHRLFNCRRIFYTAGDLRPDFSVSDFAMTLHEVNDPRHLCLPKDALDAGAAAGLDTNRILEFFVRAIEDRQTPVAIRTGWKYPGRWMLLKRNPPRAPGAVANDDHLFKV